MSTTGYRIGFSLALTVLTLGCAAGLIHVVSVVGLRVPFDPNEGWNAYFAELAMRTGSPYPPAGGFLVNNYPPLSFYLIGRLARINGDAIVMGRVVSLLSVAVTAFGIERILALMGCSRSQAIFAALLFIACLMLTSDYVGIDDPQLVGHAISLWGAFVLLRAPDNARNSVIAALLFVVAFFVKHNLVWLPLALAAWLTLVNRRSALNFIASGAIFLLIGLGIFRTLFAASLLHQLASERVYAFASVGAALRNWLPWAALPLCGAVLLYLVGRRERDVMFVVIYTAIATVGGLVLSSGSGVDANAMFDADIALVLCAGLLLNRFENEALGVLAIFFFLTPLAVLLGDIEGDWTDKHYWLQPMADDRRAAAAEISLLKATPDPVLCEMLSLCYWAGRTAEVDVFNLDQRFRLVPHSDAALVHLIEAKHYALVELEGLKPFPLAGRTEAALLRNYRVMRVDDERVFLVPASGRP